MAFILDPVGFISDIICISNALGVNTPYQDRELKKVLEEIRGIQTSLQDLKRQVSKMSQDITIAIDDASTMEIHSRVQEQEDILGGSGKLNTLIHLLLVLRKHSSDVPTSNTVFAIIVRYKGRKEVLTLGFSGYSTDLPERLVQKLSTLKRGIENIHQEKTCYIMVHTRSKFTHKTENFVSAVLYLISTTILDLPSNFVVSSVDDCTLDAAHSETVVLLKSESKEIPLKECHHLARLFLIGDTRTGKSTIGNSFTRKKDFLTSKGTTGTLKIQKGERVDMIANQVWITEIFDTPGLSDKDGLDGLFQAFIEDHIRIYQKVNALVMTVSVDGGITKAMFDAFENYKKLFGDSMGTMCIIVLTINDYADKEDLDEVKENNWPTIARLDETLKRRNVFCVSLRDLRDEESSPSHNVIDEIMETCRSFPSRLIATLEKRYREIEESLKRNAEDTVRKTQELIDDGWMRYDRLAFEYKSSPFVKLCNGEWGNMGFVMKKNSSWRKTAAILTGGVVNLIRKTMVQIKLTNEYSEALWAEFVNKWFKHHRDRKDLMQEFADFIFEKNLAFVVTDKGLRYFGTLRVHYHEVNVLNPTSDACEEVLRNMNMQLSGMEESGEFSKELKYDLIASTVPRTVVSTQK